MCCQRPHELIRSRARSRKHTFERATEQFTGKMARLILILAGAILLLNTSSADILVQPGYGQPHPVIQPHEAFQPDPKKQVQFIHQPRQWSDANVYSGDQLSPSLFHQQEAPYHVDIQPVYLENSQADSHMLGNPVWYHHPLRVKTKYFPHKHLHLMKIGGASYVRPSIFVGDPLHDPIANSRYRRSAIDGSNAGRENVEQNKNDVAAKPSLDNNNSPVVGLQNQEKQRDVSKSKTEREMNGVTLLGLNPPKLHHDYDPAGTMEHTITKNSPSSDEERSAYNYLNEMTHEQSELELSMRGNAGRTPQGESRSDRDTILVNQGSFPQVMLLQPSNPGTQPIYRDFESPANLEAKPIETMRSYQPGATLQDGSMKFDLLRSDDLPYQPKQRNFPDPRPLPHYQSKKTIPTYREDQTANNEPKTEEISTNSEIGRHETSRNSVVSIESLPNEENYKTFRPPCTPICYYYTCAPHDHCNCPCSTKPQYMVYEADEGLYNDLEAEVENIGPEVPQYDRTVRSSTSYLPSARYYYMPQPYNIYGARYGGGYMNYPMYRTYELV